MSIQSSEEYENQGLRLLQAEQPADALKVFEEGIRRFPGDADLTMGTAMAHLRLGDFARSCEILENLKRTQPGSGETLQALAEAYLSRGMAAEAVRAADEAVEGGRDDSRLLSRLGRTFIRVVVTRRRFAATKFWRRKRLRTGARRGSGSAPAGGR